MASEGTGPVVPHDGPIVVVGASAARAELAEALAGDLRWTLRRGGLDELRAALAPGRSRTVVDADPSVVDEPAGRDLLARPWVTVVWARAAADVGDPRGSVFGALGAVSLDVECQPPAQSVRRLFGLEP